MEEKKTPKDFLWHEVTVTDLDNYKSDYAEQTPFVGILTEITDYPCYWVESLKTKKKYELYSHQIKELHELEN